MNYPKTVINIIECFKKFPGIGEKTALKLIADFGSLDGIYSQSDIQGVTRSVKEKLISGKDSAYMSYELAKIYKKEFEQMHKGNYHNDKILLIQ